MVRRKYEELNAEIGTAEGEWRQYKDAFVGVAEEHGVVDRRGKELHREAKPRMVDGRGGTASGGETGSMEDDRRL